MEEIVKIPIGSILLIIGFIGINKSIRNLQAKGVRFGGSIEILSSSIIFVLAGIYLIIENL
ncbi:hypothetical protein [Pontibacter vulgaris]|uniref:hypothetical protein n=1 Tax=Pontibacter vulgaris TaxID=2905679 RepID=UPI001FA7336A|nr:hypothetical protein [Pontibacter vulgaris]